MEAISDFLFQRKQNGLLRKLFPFSFRKKGLIFSEGKKYVDFSSNDYLGLSGHPRLKKAVREELKKEGFSSSASRLLSGNKSIFAELEKKTAEFKQTESALVFNSGYQANVGAISALAKKGDAVFLDKLSHASIIDGVILSGADFFRFKHNDVKHLKELLDKKRKLYRRALIVTESVFSMDGDICPLKELVSLKKQHSCLLYVDEAHATGIFGPDGAGVISEFGLSKNVDIVMGTFSKALGSFGAYIASSKMIIDYLINTARSFIYSTALPPAVIAANLASLNLVKKEPQRRITLLANAQHFREKLKERGFSLHGESQIIPVILGNSEKASQAAEYLQDRGYFVFAIRPPTVPQNEARLRFSLTYYHSRRILDKLINDIAQCPALNS